MTATIQLHQLEGFYYVGLHAGFTRAAEAMPYPITEPALHQQVRKLERALGTRLTEQGPRRRTLLTPEGRLLHRFVTPFFERLPALVRGLAAGTAGALSIGSEALYVEALAAPALAAARRAAPGAVLRLVEGDLGTLVAGLERGELDLAFSSQAAVPEGIAFEALGRMALRLLIPSGHALAKRAGPLSLEDLRGEPLVLYERGSEGRAFTDAALRRTTLDVPVAAEASSAFAMRALVRAGVAPAILPHIGKPPARRVLPDGTISCDITELVRRTHGLPRYGYLRRAGEPPSRLILAALAAVASSARRSSPPAE